MDPYPDRASGAVIKEERGEASGSNPSDPLTENKSAQNLPPFSADAVSRFVSLAGVALRERKRERVEEEEREMERKREKGERDRERKRETERKKERRKERNDWRKTEQLLVRLQTFLGRVAESRPAKMSH